MIPQDELFGYLAAYLRIEEVPDHPNAINGLQVANSGGLSRLAVAVDACQATIDAAARAGADLLLVHHGLFWNGLEPLAGRHGRRVRALIESDIALYAAHIPLDCHPDVGNNAVLARDLGLRDTEPFGDYQGVAIGLAGALRLDREALARRLAERLGQSPQMIAGGPAEVERVAVVTGAASDLMAEAHAAGIDTFITGECPHHAYFQAEEWRINLILGGHYATETVGVQALARHLEAKFDLPWEFMDHPTGL